MSNSFYTILVFESETAAERRKNVATAEGRGSGSGSRMSRGAAKESFAPKGLVRLLTLSTAFSRGYILSPLRGYL
jgi:hypothetical protein